MPSPSATPTPITPPRVPLIDERTGLSAAVLAAPLREALAAGLIDADPSRFRASPRGLDFLNDLQSIFLA